MDTAHTLPLRSTKNAFRVPLLDRIDIHVEVPRVDYEKLSKDRLGESSAAIRQRVEAARQIQRERFADLAGSENIQPPHLAKAL